MLNDPTASAAPAPPSSLTEVSQVADVSQTSDAAAGPQAEHLEGLRVLSQAPLTLEAALEQEEEQGSVHEVSASPLTPGSLMAQYAGLLGQLVGIGLITAAVRHYGADSTLYLGVGLGGALLFAIAATLTQRPPAGSLRGRLGYAGLSLVLGLGLGLLVGGAVHFSAFPKTGVVLVPLGVAVSIAAFVARDGRSLLGRGLIPAAVTIAGLLVWLSVGLGMAAKKLDPPATPAGNSAAAAGGSDAAAGSDGGAAAEGEHGAAVAAGDHAAEAKSKDGAAAAGDHGAAPESKDAAAAAGDHGAAPAADAKHAAAPAEHGAAASTDDHGATAAKADHGTAATGDHATDAKAEEHAPEDDVTAEEVLGN